MAKKRKNSAPTSSQWTSIGIGLGAIAAGAAALAVSLVLRRDRLPSGHKAPDLAGDAAPVERAPEHFRPDPTAVPSATEREALRPTTGPGPSLVNPRGTGFEAGGEAA